MRKISNFTKTLSLRAKLPSTYGARLYNIHYTIYNVHYTLYNVQCLCTAYTALVIHFIIVQLYIYSYTVYSIHYTLYIVVHCIAIHYIATHTPCIVVYWLLHTFKGTQLRLSQMSVSFIITLSALCSVLGCVLFNVCVLHCILL